LIKKLYYSMIRDIIQSYLFIIVLWVQLFRAHAPALEPGLERAHGAIATLALPRNGRVLQAELLGKPAPLARRERMGLKPFALLFRTVRH
jgi:hypothetical protein